MPANESRIVIGLAGPAGSGKSRLADLLAEFFDFQYLGIDNFGRAGTKRWPKLLRAIKAVDTGVVVVESVAAPPAYRGLVDVLVILKVPPRVRRARLLGRGESQEEARRLVRDCQRAAKRGGDIVLGADYGSEDLAQIANEVARLKRSRCPQLMDHASAKRRKHPHIAKRSGASHLAGSRLQSQIVAGAAKGPDLALQAGLRVGRDPQAASNGHRATFSRAPKSI